MLLAIAILIAVGCAVREHWNRLGNDDPEWSALLPGWFIRGAVAPSIVWALSNLGLFSRFPALVPNIAIAQTTNQSWGAMWVDWTVAGCGYIVICWGAVTYTWMILLIAREVGDTPEFRTSVAVIGLPMFLLALIIVYRSRWTILPSGVLVALMPLVHRVLNHVEEPEARPTYGAAQGKINFGKYEAAEAEVINQLEKKDNDFNGWMLLAELYATKYHRLDDAAQVVVDLCRDPSITEIEASLACNRLADWQLEIGMNPSAARAALDLLIQRAPDSHVAQLAQQRLKQMPLTREDLLDRRKPKSIRLPALREAFAAPEANGAAMAREEIVAEANRLSDRLRHEPNDFDTRERLAILLAEKLGQVDSGIEQLRLMINMPDAASERAAKWMAQIASWERHLNKNEAKFRVLLNEIIRKHPNSTHAISARRQLQLIEQEELQKTVQHETAPPPKIRLQMPEA